MHCLSVFFKLFSNCFDCHGTPRDVVTCFLLMLVICIYVCLSACLPAPADAATATLSRQFQVVYGVSIRETIETNVAQLFKATSTEECDTMLPQNSKSESGGDRASSSFCEYIHTNIYFFTNVIEITASPSLPFSLFSFTVPATDRSHGLCLSPNRVVAAVSCSLRVSGGANRMYLSRFAKVRSARDHCGKEREEVKKNVAVSAC